ncbi:Ppx/GppA phosphatase family protein [Negadavirga shengliensis]|uniref:Ppx/GppA phosphatase family protein n=1 Tax=Negadavirga shengliensis TaxID=1389218 RepID=A0ABV9T9P5_9BACT
MNLAAIDIGTNSIHMIIVKVLAKDNFEILMQEKTMVKLGSGVFATKELSPTAFESGIETIKRYVQLADQYGVDDIITSATSATREAKNGREFLDRLIAETGISPQLIPGKEEARLIFMAVRRAIALKKEKVLVLDIGGGSTEAVTGDDSSIDYASSIKLGVLRLLDWVGHEGALDKKSQDELVNHIRQTAEKNMTKAREAGFNRVIGTSGTIRTLAEACLSKTKNPSPEAVNAEVVSLKDLEKLREKLVRLSPEKRAEITGISSNRTDAIHLGAILLVELLHLAGTKEITISDASLREGMIINHIEKHGVQVTESVLGKNVRERSTFLLAMRYEANLEEKKHIARLALQLFDQLKHLHHAGDYERELLYHACLVFDVGLYVKFQNYHKHSRYIIENSLLRGFTNEEVLLLGYLARYHRKSGPKKKHKKFRKLSQQQRSQLSLLSGILRIAVGLDKTKNQWAQNVYCLPEDGKLTIKVFGQENLDLEIWEAQRYSNTLAKYLHKEIHLENG